MIFDFLTIVVSRPEVETGNIETALSTLRRTFPYWLYFLSKYTDALACITLCFLPPFLTQEARAEEHPRRLNDLLSNRWFPAMNHLAVFSGLSETELESLTERVLRYYQTGKFPLPSA
jgi:hypothetical protein